MPMPDAAAACTPSMLCTIFVCRINICCSGVIPILIVPAVTPLIVSFPFYRIAKDCVGGDDKAVALEHLCIGARGCVQMAVTVGMVKFYEFVEAVFRVDFAPLLIEYLIWSRRLGRIGKCWPMKGIV